jgi:Ion channel
MLLPAAGGLLSSAHVHAYLTKHRFLLLFLFLLATLVIYPHSETNRFSYYALRFAGSAVIVASVYAVSLRHGVFLLVCGLAAPVFIERVFLPEVRVGSPVVMGIVVGFAFDLLIVIVLFRRVFAQRQTTSEMIFGALCIYLLLGFSFANVYHLLGVFAPNAFYLDPTVNLHVIPNRFDFVYYSFATITSLGASGIVPVTPQARSFTILEGILGVLYLAVLVARLIAAYRPEAEIRS